MKDEVDEKINRVYDDWLKSGCEAISAREISIRAGLCRSAIDRIERRAKSKIKPKLRKWV